MIRLLTIITLILAIVLFPPATLAVISNTAVPGDVTYPIKRFLEDGIFAVASITPVTKAWFAAARSDRRFQEITVLADRGKSIRESLNELVEQTRAASGQINDVKDTGQKKQLIDKLSRSIKKYDQGLKEVSKNKQLSIMPPLPTPVNLPKQSSPSPTYPVGERKPQPTPSEYQPAQPTDQPQYLGPPQQDIEDARERLEEIRRRMEEERIRLEEEERLRRLQTSSTPTPTPKIGPTPPSTSNPVLTPFPTPTQKSTLLPTPTPSPTPSGRSIHRIFSQPENSKIFTAESPAPTATPQATCQTDCKYCPLTQTCGATTYDTCTDNLGRKNTEAAFCTGGAVGFRCFAKDNQYCQSADEGVYNYSCSACPSS